MPLAQKYQCQICNHVYDPTEGDPLANVHPGTEFANLPAEWTCPECGAMKDEFTAMAD